MSFPSFGRSGSINPGTERQGQPWERVHRPMDPAVGIRQPSQAGVPPDPMDGHGQGPFFPIRKPLCAPSRTAPSRPTYRGEQGGWTHAAQWCLALAILIPPFLFGAREAYGQLVLAAIVLV